MPYVRLFIIRIFTGGVLRPPTRMAGLAVNQEGQACHVTPHGGQNPSEATPGLSTLGTPTQMLDALATNEGLESILSVGYHDDGQSIDPLLSDLDTVDLLNRPLGASSVKVPTLTRQKMREALSVIPEDYWSLSCWTCRNDGHSTFTCPYLTAMQRVLFAFQYYQYQVRNTPHMKGYLEQREKARRKRIERGGASCDEVRSYRGGRGGQRGREGRSPSPRRNGHDGRYGKPDRPWLRMPSGTSINRAPSPACAQRTARFEDTPQVLQRDTPAVRGTPAPQLTGPVTGDDDLYVHNGGQEVYPEPENE